MEDKSSEDLYADVDFSEQDDLSTAEFLDIEPQTVKFDENKEEKSSRFYGEGDKLLAEKIITKKTGEITEITYGALGQKKKMLVRGKDKKPKKCTEYFENGSIDLVTEYLPDGSYRSMAYNIDGSRQSFVVKYKDGTADAVYYDVNKSGANLVMKLDSQKNVIEKHLEK